MRGNKRERPNTAFHEHARTHTDQHPEKHLDDLLGRSLHAEEQLSRGAVGDRFGLDVDRELVFVGRIKRNFTDFGVGCPVFRRVSVNDLRVLRERDTEKRVVDVVVAVVIVVMVVVVVLVVIVVMVVVVVVMVVVVVEVELLMKW